MNIKMLVTSSLLAAIGVVLMAFVEVPYPLAPWLKIEFSDIVILIAFSLFGFKGAFTIAIVKTLGDLLFEGPSGPLAIGQITALIASMSYVIISKVIKLDIINDNIKKILIKNLIILLCVTTVLTVANYILITPIYSGEMFWFQLEDGLSLSYLVTILTTYIPFNLIKGSLILGIYTLIGKRIVNIYKKD